MLYAKTNSKRTQNELHFEQQMHGFDLKSGSFVALTFRPASADLKGGGVPEKTERQGHSRQGGPGRKLAPAQPKKDYLRLNPPEGG